MADLREKVKAALLSMQRYSWEQGTAMQAMQKLGDTDMLIRMAYSAVLRQDSDFRPAIMGENEAETDPLACGEGIRIAAAATGDPSLRNSADRLLHWALEKAPRNADGMIYHKYPECEIWVDSLFMLPPCLAAAGEYKEAVRQYFGISSLLQDPDSGLLRHIWNDSEKRYPDPMLWSVGNGWAVCGAAHLIELLPDTMPSEKEKLRQFSAALIDRILACLGPDALLHNDLQDPYSFTEVNGAQMTAAAIYSGLSGNWLPPACRVTADRIYAAVCRKVDRFGFLHDVCGAPCFVAPGIAPEGNAMFLIMDAEKEAYERQQS